ncbi:hypothetical protein LJC60_04000 [Ruminococcaceae bacterium OttesenSCG-928-D13]|nr:hypothetical protein [Ruminococcaceae bacterium OttesenSCG-928-D13]
MKTEKTVSRQRAMKNATFSLSMAGFNITSMIKQYGQQVLDGKMILREAVVKMNLEKNVISKSVPKE